MTTQHSPKGLYDAALSYETDRIGPHFEHTFFTGNESFKKEP